MAQAFKRWVYFLSAVLVSGCTLVDEDLAGCENECRIDYELQLVTNMSAQLQTALSLETDISVSAALHKDLQEVFTDFAHDVDLSFFDTGDPPVLLHHENHLMDGSQSSYTLHIPVRDYCHLAVANLSRVPGVMLDGSGLLGETRLHQEESDTLDSHGSSIFTARKTLEMSSDPEQTFDVNLFMANCSEVLVVDTLGSGVKDVKVFASGFATDFLLADSLYFFSGTPVFRTRKLEPEEGESTEMCFVCVNFPSRDVEKSKMVIEVDDPEVEESAPDPLWNFRVYATLADGTVTETLLGVRKPVQAAHLRVIKARMFPDGAAEPEDHSVGMSITLDWSPGIESEIDL